MEELLQKLNILGNVIMGIIGAGVGFFVMLTAILLKKSDFWFDVGTGIVILGTFFFLYATVEHLSHIKLTRFLHRFRDKRKEANIDSESSSVKD